MAYTNAIFAAAEKKHPGSADRQLETLDEFKRFPFLEGGQR
jgi:hypothetical protein